MKNKLGTAKTGVFKALILAAGVASVARAGIGYLPLTGPPAMRVYAMKSLKPVPSVSIETSTKVLTADTNCPPIDIKAFNTNTTETIVGSAGGSSSTLPAITLGPDNPLDIPGGVSVFALPKQNVPGITPQILATYFQPMTFETNGAAVAAPSPRRVHPAIRATG